MPRPFAQFFGRRDGRGSRFKAVVRSNDHEFERCAVERYATTELLRKLSVKVME